MTASDPSLTQPRQPTARQQVQEIKTQAIDQARQTIRDARDRAASSLSDSKGRFADQIGGVAQAFREASGTLRSENQAKIAGLTDSLTAQADHLAAYLRDRDGRAMLNDLDRLARRQPAL